jgi:DNA-directed RNA polymerase subunit RPC12/RpoP
MKEEPKECKFCGSKLIIDLDNFFETKFKDNVFKFYVCHKCGKTTTERVK